MTRIWAALAGAVVAIAAAVVSVPAAANDLFEVRGVPVSAQAGSPEEAKTLAIRNGLTEAWARMFRRLTAQTEWGKLPALPPEQIAAMIVAFNPVNEGTSATQYQAAVSYTFKPNDVRKALRAASVSWSETRAKPVLILPIMNGDLWGAGNAWRDIWTSGRFGGGLQPIVAPVGGADDMQAVSAQNAFSAGWAQLEPLAQRYDAGEILVAEATQVGAGTALNLLRITPRGNAIQNLTVPGDLAAAAAETESWIEEQWKQASAVDYASRSSVTVLVNYTSLGDWASLRKRLTEVNNVARLGYSAVAATGAAVEIVYVGRMDQLLGALERGGLMLAREGEVTRLMPYDAALIEELKAQNLYVPGQIPILPAATGAVVTPVTPVPAPVTP